MMEKNYDTIVVGGGPIGGNVARNLSKRGYDTLLVEEHKYVGIPFQCAGLVTTRVFDNFDSADSSSIQNTIYGAHIHSPKNNVFTIGGNKKHAFVIDRTQFDNEILKEAEKKGTKILLGHRVRKIEGKDLLLENIKDKQEKKVSSKLLIGADGPYSIVRKTYGLPGPDEKLIGLVSEFTAVDLDSRFVDIFVGKQVAPGFFAWVIPISKDGTKARVGLCVREKEKFNIKHYFEIFLDSLEKLEIIKKDENRKQKITGGVIPLGVLQKTFTSNVMVVGDAAAQVKPTSGGGVYTGLKSSEHCVTTALNALEKNDFSERSLGKYQTLWMDDIGKELKIGMRLRRFFLKLSDEEIEKFLSLLDRPAIQKMITKHGDMDYPSKLLKIFATKPRLVAEVLPLFVKKIF